MFHGWMRADVISALALVVSALAFVVALAAARYSAVQAGVARRKERSEVAAQEPVAELVVGHEVQPGIWSARLHIKNRIDVTIVCETLRAVTPKTFRLAERELQGGYVVDPQPISTDLFAREITGDWNVSPAGSTVTMFNRTHAQDRVHVDLLLLVPDVKKPGAKSSVSPSKVRQSLTMSLSVRRTNESVSYAEIIVVTKMPAVSTSNET